MVPSPPEPRRSPRKKGAADTGQQPTGPHHCKKCPPPHPLQKECTIHSRRAQTRALKAGKSGDPLSPVVSQTEGSHTPPTNSSISLLPLTPPVSPENANALAQAQPEQSRASQQGSHPPLGQALSSAFPERLSPPDIANTPTQAQSEQSRAFQHGTEPPQAQVSLSAFPERLSPPALPPLMGDFSAAAILTQDDPYGLRFATTPFMEPLVDAIGQTNHQEVDRPSASSHPDVYAGNSVPSPTTNSSIESNPTYSPISVSVASSSPPSTPSQSSRIRYPRTYLHGRREHPTHAHPSFGMMSANKGSLKYEVVCTGSLIGRVERKDMNRRFMQGLDRILLKCERLADETGCWLQIGANHPSVHGEYVHCEYVHWMSPSMRQDLPPDTQARFDSTTSGLFSALKAVRRENIVDVHLKASQCRAELDAAKTEVAKKQALIDKLIEYVSSQGGDVGQLTGSRY
ncbi:hypothetical protein PM082_015513 [Marasmius tenuissimus]|nr:hypothetical protein PM082_015513 [Marasmius tenuissimus]